MGTRQFRQLSVFIGSIHLLSCPIGYCSFSLSTAFCRSSSRFSIWLSGFSSHDVAIHHHKRLARPALGSAASLCEEIPVWRYDDGSRTLAVPELVEQPLHVGNRSRHKLLVIVQLLDIREGSHDILNVHRVEALDVEIAVMLPDADDAMHIVRVLVPAERLKQKNNWQSFDCQSLTL